MNGKAFLVLVFFFMLLFLVISGMMGDADLTPRGSGGSVLSGSNSSSSASSSNAEALMIDQDPCSRDYRIQPGDTLSSIARRCGLALNDLLAANPGIYNPHLVHPGQEITIPGGQENQQVAVAETNKEPDPQPTNTPQPEAPAPQATVVLAAEGERVEVTAGPGTKVLVKARVSHPNVTVNIQVAKSQQGPFEKIAESQSDASGLVEKEAWLPGGYNPGDDFVIAVVRDQEPVFILTAEPQKVPPKE